MSVFEYTPFEDIDILLKRDWFLDQESILELLWTADQDTYDKIVANRMAYSMRIRWMLCPEDFMIKMPEGGLKNRRPGPKRPWKSLVSCVEQSTSSPTP